MALRVKLSIFYHSFQHHVHYFDKFFGSDVGEVEQISTLRIGDIFLQFQIFGNTAQQIFVALPQFTSAMNKGNGKEYNYQYKCDKEQNEYRQNSISVIIITNRSILFGMYRCRTNK